MHTDQNIDTTIEAFAAAGMLPADEFEPAWLGRFDAVLQTETGWIVARSHHDDVTLSALTEFGATRTSARFDLSDLGLAMLTAAALALAEVA